MACCLRVPIYYPNECWLISRVQWYSFLQELPQPPITTFSLDIAYQKFNWNLPNINESNCQGHGVVITNTEVLNTLRLRQHFQVNFTSKTLRYVWPINCWCRWSLKKWPPFYRPHFNSILLIIFRYDIVRCDWITFQYLFRKDIFGVFTYRRIPVELSLTLELSRDFNVIFYEVIRS